MGTEEKEDMIQLFVVMNHFKLHFNIFKFMFESSNRNRLF